MLQTIFTYSEKFLREQSSRQIVFSTTLGGASSLFFPNSMREGAVVGCLFGGFVSIGKVFQDEKLGCAQRIAIAIVSGLGAYWIATSVLPKLNNLCGTNLSGISIKKILGVVALGEAFEKPHFYLSINEESSTAKVVDVSAVHNIAKLTADELREVHAKFKKHPGDFERLPEKFQRLYAYLFKVNELESIGSSSSLTTVEDINHLTEQEVRTLYESGIVFEEREDLLQAFLGRYFAVEGRLDCCYHKCLDLKHWLALSSPLQKELFKHFKLKKYPFDFLVTPKTQSEVDRLSQSEIKCFHRYFVEELLRGMTNGVAARLYLRFYQLELEPHRFAFAYDFDYLYCEIPDLRSSEELEDTSRIKLYYILLKYLPPESWEKLPIQKQLILNTVSGFIQESIEPISVEQLTPETLKEIAASSKLKQLLSQQISCSQYLLLAPGVRKAFNEYMGGFAFEHVDPKACSDEEIRKCYHIFMSTPQYFQKCFRLEQLNSFNKRFESCGIQRIKIVSVKPSNSAEMASISLIPLGVVGLSGWGFGWVSPLVSCPVIAAVALYAAYAHKTSDNKLKL